MLSVLFNYATKALRAEDSNELHRAPAATPAVIEGLEGRTLLSVTPVTFTINAPQSFATLSSSGFAKLSPQAAGSLTTHYSGSISTKLSGSSIQFSAASIAAANNGSYQPGGTPGDYAGQVAGLAEVVLRNLVFNLTSGKLGVSRSGKFSSSGEKFHITAGEADYLGMGFLSAYNGSKSLVGLSAKNPSKDVATVVVKNHVATLTLPLNAKVTVGAGTSYKTTFAISGTIVATANVP